MKTQKAVEIETKRDTQASEEEAGNLSAKDAAFVEAILQGESAPNAYRTAFGGTQNPASVRSLASRVMRKEAVQLAIRDGLEAQRNEAIQSGLWNWRTSIAARIRILESIEGEINRRQRGLQIELDGIEADKEASEEEKAQRKGRAMQRPLIDKGLVQSQVAICDTLDALAFTQDSKKADWFEVHSTPFNDPYLVAKRKEELNQMRNEIESTMRGKVKYSF